MRNRDCLKKAVSVDYHGKSDIIKQIFEGTLIIKNAAFGTVTRGFCYGKTL